MLSIYVANTYKSVSSLIHYSMRNRMQSIREINKKREITNFKNSKSKLLYNT